MTCVMVQGTTSDAGKSVLVAGICRVLARRGIKVAPFKPQNMSLNSAVTVDGGEIGRAQALQAQACGLEPHSDMNPILLKPSSDTGAQVIVHGKAITSMEAMRYHKYKQIAQGAVLASWNRLTVQYEAVIVEGAGSPAEINLRENDIANMGFAEAADCPVILIADIDRGGVFAHIVGTLELLSSSERERIKGFVINRFRGDITLLQPGIEWLEQYTGKPVLGVIPYLQGLHLDAEDAINAEQNLNSNAKNLKINVPVFSRISNHTDFDALRIHPQVDLNFVGPGQSIPACDLIVLPGSKNVRRDLQWLRENGWENAIRAHLRYGGKLIGICGGFQMLGHSISDPEGIEDQAGESPGLGLLEINSDLKEEKQLERVTGQLVLNQSRFPVTGYEIHCGVSAGSGMNHFSILLDDGRTEGCLSPDNKILGTYLHGLFDHPQSCDALMQWAGLAKPESIDLATVRERQLDRLADTLEQTLDERLFSGDILVSTPGKTPGRPLAR